MLGAPLEKFRGVRSPRSFYEHPFYGGERACFIFRHACLVRTAFCLLVGSGQHPSISPGGKRGPFKFLFLACQLSSAPPLGGEDLFCFVFVLLFACQLMSAPLQHPR